jgi:hypothetical protein
MTENLVCPNTETCSIYRINYTDENGKYNGDKAKLNPIQDDGENYSCWELRKFKNQIALNKQVDKLSSNTSKCALIELLNNSRML